MVSHSSATARQETLHTTISNTLKELVRRVDTLKNENNASERIEALTEMICGGVARAHGND